MLFVCRPRANFCRTQKKRLYAVGTPVKSFTDIPIGEL
jgi:hypothetical protein